METVITSAFESLALTNRAKINLNIYNSKVKVTFVDFLRDEKKFSGIEMLKRQVKSDILKAKKIFK